MESHIVGASGGADGAGTNAADPKSQSKEAVAEGMTDVTKNVDSEAMGKDPKAITGDDLVTNRRQTEALLEEIAMETKQQELTSERKDVSSLEAQYQNSNENFRAGLKDLQQRYQSIRTIRGDGNCYYRAFLYALLEQFLSMSPLASSAASSLPLEAQRILDFFQTASWKNILSLGYDEMALEIFHDEIVELVERVVKKSGNGGDDVAADAEQGTGSNPTKSMTPELFHSEMNQENGVSDYCTWYLRVVTATHLQQDPDRFYPFLLDAAAQQGDANSFGLDIKQFCAKYIEPMGQECEQLQVLALAEAVGVSVQIEYLDGRPLFQQTMEGTSNDNDSSKQTLHRHVFGPEAAATRLTLLYRPGHYDILYPK